ncbi:hypothetical protein ACN38_g8681 [Penicillium nordicum]|uniref:Uncharacterized protein n=1 Tax=Penicillium nordicum TaxID=229535 RepID=A0A0M8NVY4_9EURO|nr:hypothetical protein ACN38_g8681 [Penicillium nordicum]
MLDMSISLKWDGELDLNVIGVTRMEKPSMYVGIICWVPLETDPLCAVDNLSLSLSPSLLLSFSSPSNRKQRILQCYFSDLNHVDSLL